jgi:HSP20 family protein
MALHDLIPWRRPGTAVQRRSEGDWLTQMQEEMSNLFDSFLGASPLTPATRESAAPFSPRVDVVETGKDIRVTAELPGMSQDDISVELNDGGLSISGEKKEEHEDKKEGYYSMERSYGRFSRFVPLPSEIEPDKVKADYKKGILTVTVPKTPEASTKRVKVDVQSE